MKSPKASDAPNKSQQKENTAGAKQHSPAVLATPNSNKKVRILASKSPLSQNENKGNHEKQGDPGSPLQQFLRHHVPTSNDIVLEYKDSGVDSRPIAAQKLPRVFHHTIKKNLKAYYTASSKQRQHIVHKVALEMNRGGCRFLQSSISGNDKPPIKEPQAYHILDPRASIVTDFVEGAFAKYHVTEPGPKDIVCGEKRVVPESARLVVHKFASKGCSDAQISAATDEIANTGHLFLFAIKIGKSYVRLDNNVHKEEVYERMKKSVENCYYKHYNKKKTGYTTTKKKKQINSTNEGGKKKPTSAKAPPSVDSVPAPRRARGRPRKKPSYKDDSSFEDPSPKRHKPSSHRVYSSSLETDAVEDPILEAKIQKLTVGSLVAVYWENHGAYFAGEITKYTLTVKGKKNKFYIEYEDSESEWFDPRERKWFFTMHGKLPDESLPPSPLDSTQAATGLSTANYENTTWGMQLFPVGFQKLTSNGVTEDNIGFIRGTEGTTFKEAREQIENDLVPDTLPADARWRFVLPAPMNCPVTSKQERTLKVVETNPDKSTFSKITIEILELTRQW